MSTLSQPSADGKMHFRFLDLPAELRNRIYDYASLSSNSIQVMHEKSEKLDSIIVKEECFMHDTRSVRKQSNRDRMALLLANRQINKEASQIYFSNLGLDLSYVFLPSAEEKLQDLVLLYGEKLRAIRHVELCTGVAKIFLWASATDTSAHNAWRWWWISDYGNITSVTRMLLTFRIFMANIESITIKEGGLETANAANATYEGDHAISHLGKQDSRTMLHRNFPKLRDIVLQGEFGVERFIKTKEGEWERAYTHEKILQDHMIYHEQRDFAVRLPLPGPLKLTGRVEKLDSESQPENGSK